ncbi:MAG: SDR family NAD(P)-dependent oxidoreductase [Fusobacteriaceae bacterium]
MNNVKGKLVLITGASNGIGKSIALEYGKLGANLILMGRNEEALKTLKQEIEKNNLVNIFICPCDIRNFKLLKEKIDNLPDELKKIDILINNAGLAIGLEKLYLNEEEDIDTVIDTNIKGILYMIKLIVPLMLERDIPGHIINMGSIAGNYAYGGGGVYCASKAAVKTISDGLRVDLVESKIRVTTILPGIVETDFSLIRFKGDKERAKNVYKGIESLTPEDVAGTVIYVSNLPDNVQITDLTLTPVNQANGTCVHKI